VFCACTELEVLRQSKYIVGDGTFEMCPETAYQLYTLHHWKRKDGSDADQTYRDKYKDTKKDRKPKVSVESAPNELVHRLHRPR